MEKEAFSTCFRRTATNTQNLDAAAVAIMFGALADVGYCAGGELRGGVNPLRDRLKLDNSVTRAMQDVMKHVRVTSNRHLRNWEAPDALVQEIITVAR